MKKAIFFTSFLILFGFLSLPVFAQENPINNKFGIHLAVPAEEDLQDAADLVNSSGGDWGYVTLVIQENDREKGKWQDVFDRLREWHLIPIVRIATSPQDGGFWRRPDISDLDVWVDFLDSLNWVIKNRYVVLFNEVNHGTEWGNEVNPAGYALLSLEFAKKLKEKNNDFFIMLAGFDAAAPQSLPGYADEEWFLNQMFQTVDVGELEQYLDGWASHSYPNHGFVGSPYASGRNSVKTYMWELDLLRKLGFKKDLPVFITETGWPHFNGITGHSGFVSERQAAENFRVYFARLINDEKVVAITPFILNYQADPFDHFSWQKMGDNGFYQQYDLVRNLVKVPGEPVQEHKLKLETALPQKLTRNSTYQFDLVFKNNGQAIWDRDEGYYLDMVSENLGDLEYFFSDIDNFSPMRDQTISFFLKTKEELDKFDLEIGIMKNGQPVSNKIKWQIEIVPAINLGFEIGNLLWHKQSGDDFKFLIYDLADRVVFGRENVSVADGWGEINSIDNIAFGRNYRLVLVKPFYLPRQTFIVFEDGKENQTYFKPLLPIDFDNDGRFSLSDLFFWRKKDKL